MIFRKCGGGSKAVWNISENSSVLDVSGIPYLKYKDADALQRVEYGESIGKKQTGWKTQNQDDR